MADTKAWELVGGCLTSLGAILVANGYRTDAGAQVTREPAQEPASADPLLCVFIDTVEKPTDPAKAVVGWLVNVLVIGKLRADQDDAQQRQLDLLDDIELAMSQGKTNFPAGMQFPRFQEAKFINRVQGLTWVGVAVRYTAHITRPRA